MTGYWEPNADFVDEGLEFGDMQMEDGSDEDEEVDEETAKKIHLAQLNAKKNALME